MHINFNMIEIFKKSTLLIILIASIKECKGDGK